MPWDMFPTFFVSQDTHQRKSSKMDVCALRQDSKVFNRDKVFKIKSKNGLLCPKTRFPCSTCRKKNSHQKVQKWTFCALRPPKIWSPKMDAVCSKVPPKKARPVLDVLCPKHRKNKACLSWLNVDIPSYNKFIQIYIKN